MKTMLKTLLLAVLTTATLELPAPTAQEKTDTMREKAAALAAGSPLYMVNSVLDEMKDVIYWVDFNREMLGTHNNPAFRNDDGTYYTKDELENLQVDYKEIHNALADRFGLPHYSNA